MKTLFLKNLICSLTLATVISPALALAQTKRVNSGLGADAVSEPVIVTFSSIEKESKSGQEKGGGSKLKSAFKTAANKLGLLLMSYPKTLTNAHLKFSTEDFVSATMGVEPKCARGEELKQLREEKDLALVKGDGSRVIWLNCYVESPNELDQQLKQDWKIMLQEMLEEKPLSSQSKVLLAHEILRTYVADPRENAYLLSGSIIATELAIRNSKLSQVQRMMYEQYSEHNKCRVFFDVTTTCGDNVTKTTGDFLVVAIHSRNNQLLRNFCDPKYTGSRDMYRTSVLDPNSNFNMKTYLLDFLTNLDCFQY